MLIIGYKPAEKLEAKYRKKGYIFRWVKTDKIEQTPGYEIAHRKIKGKNIPIEYKELILMGCRK